ncbi:hypothetical protein CTI12_AA087440 [Artemisia annua]|uniref:Uncharacterized protein n=1 Tax=Artemisia annua TaxID=35608 RepID=A0A2U1PSI1_ARTAN|nr:hypothetical protein CTI12_AA087440 [Artemisia annua]
MALMLNQKREDVDEVFEEEEEVLGNIYKGTTYRYRRHECSGSMNATSDHSNTTRVHGCSHNCGSLHASAMHPLASSILGVLVFLCLA